MNYKTIATFLLFITALSILSSEKDEMKRVKVQSLNNDFPIDKIGQDYSISSNKKYPPLRSSLPKVEFRDRVFKDALLTKETSQMDDLSKDMLYLKAKKHKLSKLEKLYPKINITKLKKLKELAMK